MAPDAAALPEEMDNPKSIRHTLFLLVEVDARADAPDHPAH
jgi:hypothetical protein